MDVLVNNAALLLFENEGVLSPASGYGDTFETNVFGVVEVCRVFVPDMARRHYGGASSTRLLQTRPDRALRAFEASMRRLGLRQETKKRLAPAAGLEELPSAIGIPETEERPFLPPASHVEQTLQNDVDFQQARSSSQ